MATYLYCVWSDAVMVPEALTGIDGGRVRAVAADGVHAWVSEVSDAARTPSIERLRAHDAVCAAGVGTGQTPLPVRFGQVFADDTAAVRALVQRAEALARRLDRVTGCVEMRVVVAGEGTSGQPMTDEHQASERASLGGGGGAGDGPGTSFLRRVAAAGRAELAREVLCEEVRHAVRNTVSRLLVDHAPCESARGLSYIAVLVRRDDVGAFRSAVQQLFSSRPVDLSILGPFAPYSFATDA